MPIRKTSPIVKNPKKKTNFPLSFPRRKRSQNLTPNINNIPIFPIMSSITSGCTTLTTTTTTTYSSSSSSSTKGNGNSQACAACKYQRRKCAPDCILAPYFPHDRQHQFINAHRLFGVSNITKIIKPLSPQVKDEAMKTIIFQSDVRAADPVGGCYRIIQDLQRLIDYNKAELDFVLHQLAICRAQQQDMQQINEIVVANPNPSCGEPMIGVDPFNPMQFHYLQPQLMSGGQDQGFVFVHNGNGVKEQEGNALHEDMNMWAMQDSISSLHIKHGMSAGDCGDDVKPFVDIACDEDQRNPNDEIKFQAAAIGDNQSDDALLKIVDGNLKEIQHSESASHQQIQHHQHHQDHGDLKGEASSFMTLTNCSS